jgi:hypothetical protein
MDRLGFEPSEMIRLNNWGLLDDRVVAIDYAEKWQALQSVWAYLLDRLAEGPVRLDNDERARLYSAWSRNALPRVAKYSLLDLCHRAGLDPRPEPTLLLPARNLQRWFAQADPEPVEAPRSAVEAFLEEAGIPREYRPQVGMN